MTDRSRFAAAYVELSELDLVADSNNPHFKNKYASINAYFQLIKPVLRKHKLLLVSSSRVTPDKSTIVSVRVITFEGDTLEESEFLIPDDLQLAALGGWITYNFRYCMRGLFALPTEVDLDAPPMADPTVASAAKKTSILSTKR